MKFTGGFKKYEKKMSNEDFLIAIRLERGNAITIIQPYNRPFIGKYFFEFFRCIRMYGDERLGMEQTEYLTHAIHV